MAWTHNKEPARTQVINGRVTDTEFSKIQKAAAKLNMSVSKLIQKFVMQGIQEMK